MPILPATSIEIRDEGTTQGYVGTVDYVGAGVTATVSGDVATVTIGGGGGGAPTDATYIVQTPNASLTNEQAISDLASGILQGTTGTGVITSLPYPGSTSVFLRGDGAFAAPTAAVGISQTTVDFGPSPVMEMLFTVADAAVTSTSKIRAWIASVAPTGKDLDEVQLEPLVVWANPSTTGTGFIDFLVRTLDGSTVSDQFVVQYLVGA
jgi:hypothetical protein